MKLGNLEEMQRCVDEKKKEHLRSGGLKVKQLRSRQVGGEGLRVCAECHSGSP